MSNRPNHRRGEDREVEHGLPRNLFGWVYEYNKRHFAKGHALWKRVKARLQRRRDTLEAFQREEENFDE